ncbi:unnamed protein product [Mytilus coruscus]|uniref:Tyr recombinase domain-containing protein n=1 Tax=Mytilus coruscus TaxID=42192 RepID=A0A6J8CVM3_MYTCO|nr:unnamed protein product [Mytilus coruscus]
MEQSESDRESLVSDSEVMKLSASEDEVDNSFSGFSSPAKSLNGKISKKSETYKSSKPEATIIKDGAVASTSIALPFTSSQVAGEQNVPSISTSADNISNSTEPVQMIFSDNESDNSEGSTHHNLDHSDQLGDIEFELPNIFEDSERYREEVEASVSNIVETVIRKKADVASLVKKEDNKIPSNCKGLNPPAVNAEIWQNLDRKARSQDIMFQTVQRLMGLGIVPILRIAQMLKTKSFDQTICRELVSRAIAILCNAFFEMSVRRRMLLRPAIDRRFNQLINRSEPVGENNLFGDDISKHLTLKELTLKCVALVALSTAHRAQTLIALDLSLMKCDNNIVTFNTKELFKTSRPKHMSPDVKICSFHTKEICPVYTLKHYIIKIKHFRKSNKLFVSYKTFKNVTTSTIARWLCDILTLAGINVSKFKAHSYRSASTSAASRAGLSLAGILKTANWSSAGTFQKFYHKEIKKSANYTESVFS